MTKPALEHPLLREHARLRSCLAVDKDHVQLGDIGDFVVAIQKTLMTLDHADIAPDELKGKSFGTSTRDAVLAYKRSRKIINLAYQNAADAVVGRMTIERLDNELMGHKNTSNPLVDPGEPARIQAVLNRERPAVSRIVDRTLALLQELLAAVELRNEEPGRLANFQLFNPLLIDALHRFCGMPFSLEASVIRILIDQYQSFRAKLPRLSLDQKPIDFTSLLLNFSGNVSQTPDGPSFPPAISDAPNAMFFTPRYRDFDSTAQPLFQGLSPAILQLIQLHEMGHFYFRFDDGDPRGKPFQVSKRFAQTYEFISRQAIFRITAP